MKNIFWISFFSQFLLLTLTIVIYELLGDQVEIFLVFDSLIICFINILLFQNKKNISKKFDIKENKVCVKFYFNFFISLILLLCLILILNELDLFLQCSGMFCGMGIAVFLFIILPLIEVSISVFCFCVMKSISYYKDNKILYLFFTLLFGIALLVTVFKYIIELL